jgi:exosortase O
MGLRISSETHTWQEAIATLGLIAAWLYAQRRSLDWLWQSAFQGSRYYLAILAIGIVLVSVQAIRHYRRGESYTNFISATPKLAPAPLTLMIGSAVLAIAFTWLVDLNQLSALFFLLGSYGLAGLFIENDWWRKNLPVAALVSLVLPFSAQFDSGLGIPARVLTAQLVQQLLSYWQISAISSHDIIVLENGIAQVDLPCSGLKSLWTGTVFLLAATWLEGRRISFRWLLILFASLWLLVAVNSARVLGLVAIAYIWQQPFFAGILHLPLGVLGFICACALTWLMLQVIPKHQNLSPLDRPKEKINLAPNIKSPLLASIAISLILVSQLHYSSPVPLSIDRVQWPTKIVSERLPLTSVEERFFNRYQNNTKPEKWRFTVGNLSGSFLVVASTSWQTYHPPELCLMGMGLKIDSVKTKAIAPSVQGRWLSLDNGQFSATYWLQSPQQTTDDLSTRIWSEISHKSHNWVLISILFDRSFSPDNPEVSQFVSAIYQSIKGSFSRG